jgi:hypothetical protein
MSNSNIGITGPKGHPGPPGKSIGDLIKEEYNSRFNINIHDTHYSIIDNITKSISHVKKNENNIIRDINEIYKHIDSIIIKYNRDIKLNSILNNNEPTT